MPNIFETTDAAANTSTTYTLGIGQTAQGNVTAGDHDWYAVNVVSGQQYTFALVGTGSNNATDTYLRLYAANGTTLLAQNDDGLEGLNSVITFTATSTGTVYLDAAGFDNSIIGQYGISATLGSRASFDTQMIGGVIDTDRSWSTVPGTAATITYAFRQTVDSTVARDASGNAVNTGSQLTAAEQAAVQTALAMFSETAGLTFTRVNPGGFSDNATMLFANYSSTTDGAGAYAYYPGSTASTAVDGDVWLNTTSVSTSSLPAGSYSYFALIHEMGHALGLSHPGLYNAGPGINITYAAHAQFTQDTHQYSIMSYFDESNTTGSYSSYPDGLMLGDIYALQQIYGVNLTTRAGNSVYGFNSNVGGIYDFTTNTDPVFCIWDGAGTDTIDASGFSQAQTINLNDGQFSNIGGLTGNISIALGAVIENAVGGSGADTLIGNSGNNILTGGGGVDVLAGYDGSDTASYVYSGVGVTVDLTAGNSWDGSAMDFLFSIENAIGTNAIDTFVGDANDNTFEGRGGNDYLQGGAGSDTASYRSAAVGVQVDLNAQYAWDGAAMDFLTSIENAIGSAQTDILVGNSNSNVLEGLGGVDFIQGGGGTDFASYRSSASGVQVDLNSQYSWDGSAMDFFNSIEGAIGSAQTDTLVGDASDNIFEGLGGVDYIQGGGGSDTTSYRSSLTSVNVDLASQVVWDGASTDFLTSIENAIGSSLADNIVGSTGANVIEGLAGNDVLTGFGGNDTFSFRSSGTGLDTIMDFDSDPTGGQDLIDLSGRGFSAGSIGTSIVISSFSGTSTQVTIGADVIYLLGVSSASVTATDFIF